jgi:hypothetical protein
MAVAENRIPFHHMNGVFLAVLLPVLILSSTTKGDILSEGEAYQRCSLGKGLPSFYTSNVDKGQQCENGTLTTTPQSLTDQRSYLVKLNNGTAVEVVDQMCSGKYNGKCTSRYKKAITGMTVLMDQPTLKGFMFDHKDFIDHVEAVGTAWVGAATIESSPPWGLDRIDQLLAQPKLDQKYTWDTARDGSGVHVYVVDTVSDKSQGRKVETLSRLTNKNGLQLMLLSISN